MKLLSAGTNGTWQSLLETDENGDGAELVSAHRIAVTAGLTSIMLSQNLVVLAGLGTSLCVRDEENATLAPTMESLWNDVSSRIGASEMRMIAADVHYPADAGQNIELLLSHCQLAELFDHTDKVARFIEAAEQLIVDRCRFADAERRLPTHEAFLRKCGRRGSRVGRLKLFTTNYDLCFEVAASKTKFVVIDGFSQSQPSVFDGQYFSYDLVRRGGDTEAPTYLPNVFHLYKLHGSVDWEVKDEEIRKNMHAKRPMIIYPRVGKFEASYEQPFLELMSRFQTEMREPNTSIVVIGSGLRDKHVAQPFLAAVRSNISARIVVVDPALAESTEVVIDELKALASRGDSRINLFSMTFEEFVTLIPDLVPPTEQEQHLNRLQNRPAK